MKHGFLYDTGSGIVPDPVSYQIQFHTGTLYWLMKHGFLYDTVSGIVPDPVSYWSENNGKEQFASRWEKLVRIISITVKFESETRWNSRAEALKPVSKYLDELLDLLQNMVEDVDETFESRSDARNLCNRILTYDFFNTFGIWGKQNHSNR
ncbi:hypothetical protein AVEN_251080-1 [Araneus ventricosus]|uniref:Uncharacterized protein n=1 Tax=Araneus ventricosus TaxID=182803 RepID=A0A4Y2WJU1_ARAVE|nr:hypothetical protein AVEN_251080-1 [Araneus ventricosus]